MPVFPFQASFALGEISPLMHGRIDLEYWSMACQTLENWLICLNGSVSRRPGTAYIAEVKDSSKTVRLIPFIYSTGEAYVIEAGPKYFRFYANGGRLVNESGKPVEIETPYAEDELWQLQFAQSWDMLYIVHANHPPTRLKRITETQWELEQLAFPAFAQENTNSQTYIRPTGQSGNISLYVTNSPTGNPNTNGNAFSSSDVGKILRLRWPPSKTKPISNLGYARITAYHSAYSVGASVLSTPTFQQLASTQGTNLWALSQTVVSESLFVYGPFLPENTDETIYVRPLGTAGTITVIATNSSTGTAPASSGVFSEHDIGRTWKIRQRHVKGASPNQVIEYKTGYFTVQEYISPSQVKASVLAVPKEDDEMTYEYLPNTYGTWLWSRPAWTDREGWPTAIGFHDERIYYAANLSKPATLWASQVNDFENFDEGKAMASDALSFTLTGNNANRIHWIASGPDLLIGTDGGEFIATGGDSPITPTAIAIRMHAAAGSAPCVQPLSVDSNVLFVQKEGRKLRELSYLAETETYQSVDLTFYANHLTEDGTFKQLAYQREPYSTVFAVTTDGRLLSMFYSPQAKVVGWARHPTDGIVESIAVIPHPTEAEEQVWLLVARQINGQTKRYIEVFQTDRQTDCSVVGTSDQATSNWYGFEHLAGKTVDVLADGGAHPQVTVSETGEIQLNYPVKKVEVGLHYDSKLTTMPIEIQLPNGTSQGKPKRWVSIFVRVYETTNLVVNDNRIVFRKSSDLLGQPVPPFTGDVSVSVLGIDKSGAITVLQDQPFSATILAIFGALSVSE